MDAFQFIRKYPNYVEDISKMVKDEYQCIVEVMRNIDPHDLVSPDAYFVSDTHAFGYVWNTFNIMCNTVISNSK